MHSGTFWVARGIFFSDAYQSETKAVASGNNFVMHVFGHYLFIEKDMELQNLWKFLKEDTVIEIPVKLFFPLAPSLDPVGLESSYSLWKQHISRIILLNEPVGSMSLRGFTGHLASPQASHTTLQVPTQLFWQPLSVSVGFVTLSDFSLCLALLFALYCSSPFNAWPYIIVSKAEITSSGILIGIY